MKKQPIKLKKLAIIFLLVTYNLNSLYAQVNFIDAFGIGSTSNVSCGGNAITTDINGTYYVGGYFGGTTDFNAANPSMPVNLTGGVRAGFIIAYNQYNNHAISGYKISGTGHSDVVDIVTNNQNELYAVGHFDGTTDFDQSTNATYNLSTNGSDDIFICKINTNNQSFIWAKKIGGISVERVYSVNIDSKDNVYITGFFGGIVDFDPGANIYNLTSNGSQDAFVCKLDKNGNFKWAVSFGSQNQDIGFSIKTDSLGNAYTSGYFIGTVDFNPGSNVFTLSSTNIGNSNMTGYLCKLDSMGNFIWAKLLPRSFCMTLDNNYNILISSTYTGNPDFDPGINVVNLSPTLNSNQSAFFILKLDSAGTFVWAKSFALNSSPGNNSNNDITTDKSNNIYLMGHFNGNVDFDPGSGINNLSSSGNYDIYVSKLNSAGDLVWARDFGGSNTEASTSIAVYNNKIYTTGEFNSTIDVSITPGTSIPLYTNSQYNYLLITIWGQSINTGQLENTINASTDINIFPNPSTGKFIFSNIEKESVIEIYDITGRLILNTTTQNTSETIDLSDKQKGVYFYKIISDQSATVGEIKQGKIIIQ